LDRVEKVMVHVDRVERVMVHETTMIREATVVLETMVEMVMVARL
jgi:hypothetical protein